MTRVRRWWPLVALAALGFTVAVNAGCAGEGPQLRQPEVRIADGFWLELWILGEELHNNHHADPRSAKFKAHWWEIDVGWVYIKLLSFVKLAKVGYARSLSAKEFAAKHYTEKLAVPVAEKLAKAGEELEKAKARIDMAKTEARAALQPPEPTVD